MSTDSWAKVRVRRWIVYVLPGLPNDDALWEKLEALVAAVVRAKGEADAQDVRHYLLAQGFEMVARSAYNRLYAHATDVPALGENC